MVRRDDVRRKFRVTFFANAKDNKAKGKDMTWEELRELLTGGHVPLEDKLEGKAFSGARYRPVADLKAKGDRFVVRDTKGVRLYPRRINANVEQMELLILDYDGGLTIQQARERFKRFSHIGYTTHSHKVGTGADKFRIVLPWSTPIPTFNGRAYDDDLKSVVVKFGGAFDTKCLDASRIFFLPSVHPDRLGTEQSWANEGQLLDQFELRQQFPSARRKSLGGSPASRMSGPQGRKAAASADAKFLRPDDVLVLQRGGVIRAGDVETKVEGVKCPFHNDKNGTEFIKRVPATGNIFLYCRHCDRSYFVIDDSDRQKKGKAKLTKAAGRKEPSTSSIGQFFEGLDYEFPSRERMFEELERIGREIALAGSLDRRRPTGPTSSVSRDLTLPAHIIYTPEGSGKSALAMALARQGQRIVFACQSWSQVAEKYADFEKRLAPHGIPVSIAFSQEGQIRNRFGVKVVRRKTSQPYRPGEIDLNATFEEVRKQYPRIKREFFDLYLALYGADGYRIRETIRNINRGQSSLPDNLEGEEWDLDPAEFLSETEFDGEGVSAPAKEEKGPTGAIVLTTFALVRVAADKKDRIPRNWIVWFDDPGIQDVCDIELVPDDPAAPTEDGVKEVFAKLRASEVKTIPRRRTRMIDGVAYELRPWKQSLGFSVQKHLCVFTTTERLTLRALQRHLLRIKRQPPKVHDGMRMLDSGGKLTVLGTQYVRRRFDAIVPLLVRKVEKQKRKLSLIADGIGAKYNHTNSKGLNTLIKTDTLVEISVPHPNRVRTFCHVLGLIFKEEGQNITNDLMLDQMHQAIGRNVGFRGQGYECVVLVEKTRHRQLLRECRYSFDPRNSVIIDRTKDMGRKEKRISSSATALVRETEDFLNNFDRFVGDQRSIRHAIDHVVKTTRVGSERLSYVARLLAALTTISGVRIDFEVDSNNARAKSYRDAIDYVIENWVPDEALPAVITAYRDIISPAKK